MKSSRALLALVVVVLLACAGCSSSDDSGDESTTTTADVASDTTDDDEAAEEVALDDWIDEIEVACQDFDEAWSAADPTFESPDELPGALERARPPVDDFADAVAAAERPSDEPDAVDDLVDAVADMAMAFEDAQAAVGEDQAAMQGALDDLEEASSSLDAATAELEISGCTDAAVAQENYDRDETIQNLVVDGGLTEEVAICVVDELESTVGIEALDEAVRTDPDELSEEVETAFGDAYVACEGF